ncbi:MAG: hypothetical protein QOF25_504 [Mycobacterium sp.]|nr:hypothetical protein [Mycobacterium sp.]
MDELIGTPHAAETASGRVDVADRTRPCDRRAVVLHRLLRARAEDVLGDGTTGGGAGDSHRLSQRAFSGTHAQFL